jgi:hypothetical protein
MNQFFEVSDDLQIYSYLLVNANDDKPAIYIARLLHEADLTALIQLDSVNQIKYFLDERVHLINQVC